jgi:hypothetical protein
MAGSPPITSVRLFIAATSLIGRADARVVSLFRTPAPINLKNPIALILDSTFLPAQPQSTAILVLALCLALTQAEHLVGILAEAVFTARGATGCFDPRWPGSARLPRGALFLAGSDVACSDAQAI